MHFTYNIPPNLARALPKGTVSSWIFCSTFHPILSPFKLILEMVFWTNLMLDLICTWWTRRFCRQVNKKISSCFWTASTCVQKNSLGMLGWCSRLTYMYMHGNRGLDSHNSAHDKTSCQGLDLDLDRFVGRSPVGNNTNFVVLSEWTCKFSLIMVVNSPLKSVNCCSIDCGFRQTVPIWYCGWKGVPVTPWCCSQSGCTFVGKGYIHDWP